MGVTLGYMQRGWSWKAHEMAGQGWPVQHKRHCEVLAWLREHAPPGSRWAALDDAPEYFAPGTPELVACDPRAGLAPADLLQLDQILGISKD